MHIGGLDGMYRIVHYSGYWDDGERTGEGTIEYANGVKVVGMFERGHLKGNAKWIFPSGLLRIGVYEKGERVGWAEAAEEDKETEQTYQALNMFMEAKADGDNFQEEEARLAANERRRAAMAAAAGGAPT